MGTKISEATLRENLKGSESLPIVDSDLPKGRTTTQILKDYCATPIGEAEGTAFDGARGKAVEDNIKILPKTIVLGSDYSGNVFTVTPTQTAVNIHGTSKVVGEEDSITHNASSFVISSATTSVAGVMSAADKQKLNSLSAESDVYVIDYLVNKFGDLASDKLTSEQIDAIKNAVYNNIPIYIVLSNGGYLYLSPACSYQFNDNEIDLYVSANLGGTSIANHIFEIDINTKACKYIERNLSFYKDGDGTKFLADDGTYKAIEMPEAEGLPTFSLTDDLASGNGVISSSVWERLTAARTANTPIVVVNDMGSLPVANVAILGFGNNEQLQGTTDIIMPARINDLENYTVTQTVYQITGGGSTYQIATVTKNLKFYNSGNGTKFLSDDGTYKEITIPEASSDVYVIDYITAENGTLTDEQYQELYDAVQQKKVIYLEMDIEVNVLCYGNALSENKIFCMFSVMNSAPGYTHLISLIVNTDRSYTFQIDMIPLLNGGTPVVEDEETEPVASVSATLDPNTFYRWREVGSLTILSLSEIGLQEGNLAEYMFEFKSGATPTVLTLPENVKWIGSHTVEANKTYQVSIVNNLAVMGGA